MTLGFKIQNHSESIDNVCYRAFYPALQLRRVGHDVRVFEDTPSPALIASLDALIIVKPTNLTDLKVALLARQVGTPIIVDLCDDIFVPSYGQGRGVEQAICTAILNIASVAVTTGPVLAAKIRKLVQPNVPVVEIPNPVESESENTAIRRSFGATLLRAELRRVFGKYRRKTFSLKKSFISALPQVIKQTLLKIRFIFQYGWRARHSVAKRQPPKFPSEQVFFKKTFSADQTLDKPRPQLDQDLHLPPAAIPPPVMGAAWEGVLSGLEKRYARMAQPPEAVRVLAFMDLLQDLDILMPVIQGLMRDPRFDLKVCVTEWLVSESPRVLQQLTSNGIVPLLVSQKDVVEGTAPHLCFDAILTAVESNNPAHRVSFSLAKRAEALGQRCFTFQHGLENIGLTYFDAEPGGPDRVQFVSSRIFIWGKVEDLPVQVAPDIRARCMAVGRPRPAPLVLPNLPMGNRYSLVVGVFENLHWQRYSAAYVDFFVRDLFSAVTAYRDVLFLIKPHHAGKWISEHLAALKASPLNLLLANPTDPLWEPFTASAILQIVDGAITTPSTVALDAALAGKPVAVAAYGLSLSTYSPLPLLHDVKDWNEFIASCGAGKNEMVSRSLAFRDRSVLSGDAVPRILQSILSSTLDKNYNGQTIVNGGASDGVAVKSRN